MKIFLSLLILAAMLGPHAISALAHRSGIAIANCSQHKDGDVLPDLLGCSSYYICAGGVPLRNYCARGLYFDVAAGDCNKASLVECVITEEESGLATTTPKPIVGSDNSTILPEVNAAVTTIAPCTTTVACRTTTAPCTTTEACPPTTKLGFLNIESTTTDTSTIAPAVETNTAAIAPLASGDDCNTLPEGTYLVHPRHCRRYYVCKKKRLTRITCKLGLWFDKETLTCRARLLVTNCAAGRN